MTKTTSPEGGMNLVETLLAVKNDRFEVWKHFEERADKLGDRLWTTGTWLLSILVAIISVPFVAKFISYDSPRFPIKIVRPIPVAVIAVFGIAFCFYSYFALLDLREHIEGNWRRSTYALTEKWQEPTWGGRKRSGWNTLLVVGYCGLSAFIVLLILTFFK